MDIATAKTLLASRDDDDDHDEPTYIPEALLADLGPSDLPDGRRVGVGAAEGASIHVHWSGAFRRSGTRLRAEIDESWTRKYWTDPLNLEQYLDLVRRAVDARERSSNTMRVLDHSDDDGAWFRLVYEIDLPSTPTLREAYAHAQAIERELHAEADRVSVEILRLVDGAARRLDDGALPTSLAGLVGAVETATDANAKGRALEELAAKLLETIAGFEVVGRTRTATEEVDITVVNGSADPLLAREGPLILAECKNWSSKCDKDAFVLFREKLVNRRQRATLGLLISWNGFASTVTKEMLRDSHDSLVIVPLDGRQLRDAAATGALLPVLSQAWRDAVML